MIRAILHRWRSWRYRRALARYRREIEAFADGPHCVHRLYRALIADPMPRSVAELSIEVGAAPSTVSRALKQLRDTQELGGRLERWHAIEGAALWCWNPEHIARQWSPP